MKKIQSEPRKYNKWNAKKIFLTFIFSAATFAASFVLGNAITIAFGPGTSGIATIVVTTILVVICAKLVETRGVFTILVTLFTVLAIPTTMFGPPSPLKILIGFATGFVYDLVWYLIPSKKFSLPLAAALSTIVSIVLIFFLMSFLSYPKADYLRSILYFVIPLYGTLGFLGGVIGEKIYDKSLANLSLIKQLKS